MIHHMDMTDMACNLLDTERNHPDNTDRVGTDTVIQNMELYLPDNDMLHHNPSGYNHHVLGLAEQELVVVRQVAGVSAGSVGIE